MTPQSRPEASPLSPDTGPQAATQLRAWAQEWLEDEPNADMRQALQAMLQEEGHASLRRAFSGYPPFGTAGIRATRGAGPAFLNEQLVRKVAHALGSVLLAQAQTHAAARQRQPRDSTSAPGATAQLSVAIGYDGRDGSRFYADECARVLAAMGIAAWCSTDVVPTPIVSFAVLHLGAAAGIMVTASHNPPEYNGLKLYGAHAGQLLPDEDTAVAAALAASPRYRDIAVAPPSSINRFPASLLTAYQAHVRASVGPFEDETRDALKNHLPLRVAYSAMSGVGETHARWAMQMGAPCEVFSVPEEAYPDPLFRHLASPNPETPEALTRLFATAMREHVDLGLANDPDGDRLAVLVRRWPYNVQPVGEESRSGSTGPGAHTNGRATHTKELGPSGSGQHATGTQSHTTQSHGAPSHGTPYRALTGNEIGCLLAEYALQRDQRRQQQLQEPLAGLDQDAGASALSPDHHQARGPLVISTLVSTPAVARIAAHYGARHEVVPTGFKWIAEVARQRQGDGYRFVMGFEEAIGYLVGPIPWDKDGIGAAAHMVRQASMLRARGLDFEDALWAIRKRDGYFASSQVSVALDANAGAQRGPLDALRASKEIKQIAGHDVLGLIDYALPIEKRTHVANPQDEREPTSAQTSPPFAIPPTNMMSFFLAGGHRVMLRPSGTEPKVKAYIDVLLPTHHVSEDNEREARLTLASEAERLLSDLAGEVRTWLTR